MVTKPVKKTAVKKPQVRRAKAPDIPAGKPVKKRVVKKTPLKTTITEAVQPPPLPPEDPAIIAQIEAMFPPRAFDPPYEAYQLHQSGATWRDIAGQLGFPTASAAALSVSRFLDSAAKMQSSEHKREVLQTADDQYARLLHSRWDLAIAGDDKAMGRVLEILRARDRIHRLGEDAAITTVERLVLSANPAEYAKQLQAYVEERDAEL